MKNIQVIDGADNAAYDVFSCTDEEFELIFSKDTDIQFAEDLEEKHFQILENIWIRRVEKPNIHGIHGTLFYGLAYKKQYYPNRREKDLTDSNAR